MPNDAVVVSLGGFVILLNSRVTVEEETADKPLVVTDWPEIMGLESVINPFTISIYYKFVTEIDAGKSITI